MQTFEWGDYNELAKKILEECNEEGVLQEAKLRCVISRAYYAAFCSTRDFLEERNGRSLGIKHISVINEVRNIGSPEGNFIHSYLDKLRNIRRAVDYDTAFNGKLVSEAKFAVQKSEQIINKISKIR